MTLQEIYQSMANQYGSATGEMVFTFSDKGSMHSYIDFYESFFKIKRNRASLLEIGMMTGGSLHLWQTYFEDYDLVGMDISAHWNQSRPFQSILESDPKVTLLFGVNSRNKPVPDELQQRQFDFVIDDGDHSVMAQIETFENYWPMVGLGGTYFIEDVIGAVQIETLQNFLAQYQQQHDQQFRIEHYRGFKNRRADDQILAVTRAQS